ncbi:hypothetical protein Tco_1412509 [Tanacetum coccineum]
MVYMNNYNRVNYNYSTNRTHPNAQRNMVPRAVLMKIGLKPFNTARIVNTAHPKSTVFSAKPMSHFQNQYYQLSKGVNTARPHSAVVNAVRVNQANAVKTSTCWVWRPTKPNGASLAFKRHKMHEADPNFKEFDRGYVTFGGGAHGGRIYQKEVGTLRYLSLVVPLKKVGDEAVHKELGERMERAATTASSLEAKHKSGNINKTQSMATLNGSSP